ncbi:MAG: ribose-5-phosphate isomerase RpiA [Gammaproteobacteria bacterium]
MTPQDELKKKTAEAALEYISDIPVIGVGTGSTVNFFIQMLSDFRSRIDGAVSSSEGTTARLKEAGIPVLDLNGVGDIEIYIDGADEINPNKHLVKGGGGALTREKIIAAASKKFVCIADESKNVDVLGKFPLPIEVIPMARSFVSREMVKLGGRPVWREDYFTDNGNEIIDVHNLEILDPIAMEKTINNITGVVAVGIFAMRPADIILLGGKDGIRSY